MLPEQARDIYYDTFRKGQWKEVDKPLIQAELDRACWQAVIDAVRIETENELTKQFLETMKLDNAGKGPPSNKVNAAPPMKPFTQTLGKQEKPELSTANAGQSDRGRTERGKI